MADTVMAGQKRPAEEELDRRARDAPARESIQTMFKGFRAELDEHHDRRERIIKSSRDITAASKKM